MKYAGRAINGPFVGSWLASEYLIIDFPAGWYLYQAGKWAWWKPRDPWACWSGVLP